ncbi:Rab proteins geranylgeranyltransferase component A 2 [Thelohanellus kitauei]|uniref:Rab proteins geranylgeranyltransferase component A 2 n=1 Tax=Thelohanellus kitauei TaxID=669202 RepID=A0A0C2NL49_THEKT|nr:Rab proteins geranylgeranyltransferase component A 2 [Thelohanellus kitauei]
MCNTHNAPSTVEVSSMLLDEPENVNFHCISRLGRKFMIDLFPFVIPADGLTVNGIIDLDISHHINVFSPTSLMIYVDEVGKFNKVPLNRNQVFASDCLSLEQKNSFTKFIKNCLTDTGSENVELDDFYKVHRITHPLDDFLEFSVLSEWNTASDKRYSKYDLISGLENTLRSVRRFNTNSKYLMSFNGSQDLAHCFLRKASVMGATVCYGADIKDINDHQSCYHIGFGEDQYLNAKYIIMDHSYSYLLPKETDVEKR